MSDLSAAEMKRYQELCDQAKAGRMPPHGKDPEEWRALAERYAGQLEREGREYRERMAKYNEAHLAEKRAWAEARDKAAEVGAEPFDAPEPERDFSTWLKQKGLA